MFKPEALHRFSILDYFDEDEINNPNAKRFKMRSPTKTPEGLPYTPEFLSKAYANWDATNQHDAIMSAFEQASLAGTPPAIRLVQGLGAAIYTSSDAADEMLQNKHIILDLSDDGKRYIADMGNNASQFIKKVNKAYEILNTDDTPEPYKEAAIHLLDTLFAKSLYEQANLPPTTRAKASGRAEVYLNDELKKKFESYGFMDHKDVAECRVRQLEDLIKGFKSTGLSKAGNAKPKTFIDYLKRINPSVFKS